MVLAGPANSVRPLLFLAPKKLVPRANFVQINALQLALLALYSWSKQKRRLIQRKGDNSHGSTLCFDLPRCPCPLDLHHKISLSKFRSLGAVDHQIIPRFFSLTFLYFQLDHPTQRPNATPVHFFFDTIALSHLACTGKPIFPISSIQRDAKPVLLLHSDDSCLPYRSFPLLALR